MNKFKEEVFDKDIDERFRIKNKIFVDLSNRILNGELFVNIKLGSVEYDSKNIKEFDWDVKYDKGENTYLLYLFSLGHVYLLTKAANMSNNREFLDIAIEFVFSLESYDKMTKDSDKCVYCWYDHSVAERTENLAYLIYTAIKFEEENDVVSRLVNILRKQQNWLYDDENYVKNHNHGVIEDKALLLSAVYLNDEHTNEYVNRSITRLKAQINYGFTKDYIHSENSIGYHLGMMEFILSISSLIKMQDSIDSSYFDNVVKGALEYLVYCYKPNKEFPYFGDTLGKEITNESSVDRLIRTYENEELKYVQSMGKLGIEPRSTYKWFINSGYVFFREHWRSEDFTDSTWISFKSGYSCSTHKHRDDLSFCLYSKGYDIFIDPGMYNYVPGNVVSEYMNSNNSHNTILVDGKDYSIAIGNANKFSILHCESNSNYDYCVGVNRVNPGVEIFRHIYYDKKSCIIIRDEINSMDEHEYTQVYHLGPKCKLNQLNGNEAEIELIGSTNKAYLQQLSICESYNYYKGFENEKISLISTGFSQCNETETIEFKKNGSSTEFISVINIGEKKLQCKKIDDVIKIDDNEIRLINAESLRYQGIKVIVKNDNVIELINKFIGEGITYCYYIVDDETGRCYKKSEYSADRSYTVKLEKNKKYTVVSYIKGKYNQRINSIAAKIIVKNSKVKYRLFNSQEEIFNSNSIKIDEISNNEYKFKLNITSVLDYTIKWYIYKDGVSYDFLGSNNQDYVTYKFREKGEYTVYYRVRAMYLQEILFGTFKNIKINY